MSEELNKLFGNIQKEISDLGKRHKGSHWYRTKGNHEQGKREKALSIVWRRENKRIPCISYGYGLLQNLFMEGHIYTDPTLSPYAKLIITVRDRYIVATVIQWLGSNVGFCFLNECMKKAGYQITKINQ